MEMEHWIKRKNALRAKAIMREKKHSNFILENDVVRLAMASVPSKKNVAKLKKLTKKQKKSLSRAK